MNKSVIKFLISILIVGILAYVISTYFVQMAYVSGDSMLPTYEDGDIVFINKKFNKIEKNDVIVANKNNVVMIKRVVGVENDRIIIKDNKLYINDKEYEKLEDIVEYGIASEEITVGKDEYFVIGDNINKSIDSRYKEIGLIKKSEIIGVLY